MKKLVLFVTGYVLLVMGCSTLAVPDKVEVIDDGFLPTVTVLSSARSTNDMMLGSTQRLRGIIDREAGLAIHQLYVRHIYSGSSWAFYDSAFLSGGTEVEFTSIDRDFKASANAYFETFGVTLDQDILRNSQSGFEVKVFSDSGATLLITVDQEQIDEYLTAIADVLSAM